ncbi:hypothetical protein Pmani_009045 [Petrolisthes manimaculis]|uniref:ADAMTS-like protein 1 n=1 Tax=Petrolisthes manimaculis TaxID=1843537 RepID=A0AAE1Q4A7_9EUCA|nr:hypothetical protein Pmani_009045 [Petrolisthes manimaculis]
MLSGVCVERGSGRRVAEDNCDRALRPTPVILTCNDHACPTSWETGDWGTCSVSCGSGGYQLREVYCAEPRSDNDTTRPGVRVADHNCDPPRPEHRQSCNKHECRDGTTASGHSRSSRLCDPALRPPDTRPCRTGIPCPLPSTLAHPRHQPYTPAWWGEEQDALASEEGGGAPLLPRPEAIHGDQKVPSEPTYMKGNWSGCSVTCGEGVRTRSVNCKIFLEFSRTVFELPDNQCPGVKPSQTQRCILPPCPHSMTRHKPPDGEVSDAAQAPSLITLEDADEEDNQRSIQDHRIPESPFLPGSVIQSSGLNNVRKPGHSRQGSSKPDLSIPPQAQAYNDPNPGLHSYETHGGDQKTRGDPVLLYPGEYTSHDLFESYEIPSAKSQSTSHHSGMNSIEVDLGGEGGSAEEYPGYYQITDDSNVPNTYKWITLGFGPCSASCLGGVQESVVKCIREGDKKIVKPQLCEGQMRPDVITRTCHDQPCPPRWNISEFTECSKSCGGGIQRRDVRCIHEVTRGGTNTVEVPDSLCPQPPQRAIQHCNFVDCDAEWVTGFWSKCSASCGGGVKKRDVKCIQTKAQGDREERPPSDCASNQPRSARRCNQRACEARLDHVRNAVIKAQQNQNYVQSKFMKMLTLKVGGRATVFRGVKVKVKCPVRRFDRSRITWWHNGKKVGHRGPVRTTSRGVLKIREMKYPNAGVYICRANDSEANITLEVKPLPAHNRSESGHHSVYGNEVSLHRPEGNTDILRRPDWMGSKGRGRGRRRKGRRRGKPMKGKGVLSQRGKGKGMSGKDSTTEGTTPNTHQVSEPHMTTPELGTLGEGPFKASSKNMHTVEVSSSEATNTFEPTFWPSNPYARKPKQDYVYGTVEETSWDGGKSPNSEGAATGNDWDHDTQLSNNRDREHVYGTITTHHNNHGDSTRITSEESHVYGTVRHTHLPERAPDEVDTGGSQWSNVPSGEYLPERNPVFEGSDNMIEDELSGLVGEPDYPPDSSSSSETECSKLCQDSYLFTTAHSFMHINVPYFPQSFSIIVVTPNPTPPPLPIPPTTAPSQPPFRHLLLVPPPPIPRAHQQQLRWCPVSALLPVAPVQHAGEAREDTTHLTNQTNNLLPHLLSSSVKISPSSFSFILRLILHLHYQLHPPALFSALSFSLFLNLIFQLCSSALFSALPFNFILSLIPQLLRMGANSRGGRHAASHYGFVRDDTTTTTDPHGRGEILGKGTRDSLEFEWQMTSWSECSQTCGFTSSSSGYQVRSIQCLAKVNNSTSPVDGVLCTDAGLEAPVTIQKCGLTECPKWHVGEWSECESSRCYTLHRAYQRREVVCQIHNGTLVSNSQCDERSRPRHRQDCYSHRCTGVWRVGEWSECTAPCGGQGYRTRLLQCVWHGTKKAAGNACQGMIRPEVVRWCTGESCPAISETEGRTQKGCRDRSKYCNIVKRMNMCRIQSYRQQCCRSCP